MVVGQLSFNDHAMGDTSSQRMPRIFVIFAILGTLSIAASIAVSILSAPAHDPMFHFSEKGLNTALSTLCLSMAGAVSAMVFYLRLSDWSPGALFWLVLAAGCVFLSLDEQLEFHERGGMALYANGVETLEWFRNWNDIIVIIYGVVAMAIAALFGREILASKHFVVLFAVGFAFYAIHTAVDSTLPRSLAWKDIPEEGAKLACAYFLFLAACARFVMLIETSWRPQKDV